MGVGARAGERAARRGMGLAREREAGSLRSSRSRSSSSSWNLPEWREKEGEVGASYAPNWKGEDERPWRGEDEPEMAEERNERAHARKVTDTNNH